MDALSLVPQFGGLIWTILAFVVALSVIVAIHEYGHYIVGRWSGIEAEVFSLGFGPVIWSRTDKRGTQWQIAALPFGGYVKFLGDSNAASGTDAEALAEMSPEEQRHTMAGAPLWARSATVAAGPIFNFALSVVVFAAVIFARGEIAEPLTVGDLRPVPMTNELQEGDRILEIADMAVPSFGDTEGFERFSDALPRAPELPYRVSRDGREVAVTGPYPYPPIVTQVIPQSAALAAGLRPGDVITEVNGDRIAAFDDLREIVETSEGAALALTVWRDGETLERTLEPKRTDEPQPGGGFETHWRIGIIGGMVFEPATEMVGPLTALWGGVAQVGTVIQGSLSGLWHMVTGAISSCNLSGPIGIAETSGAMASQGAMSFIWFIAVLSTAVGLLNLFPVPVLDGGHLVFHAYEAISGRPPSDRALQALMGAGLVAILSLMAFAVFNDLFCP
ncbi:RIP metalloprotease RseP [Rhodosalinus sediminis]|uniref:RIP metalloprotease RseP n=1 Tax=Rhodosalinus sediminis TaxID=1940533 RepID=UPI00235368EB|nr:RIP metalloprotease RseP [Rhodosalinus sediminis]